MPSKLEASGYLRSQAKRLRPALAGSWSVGPVMPKNSARNPPPAFLSGSGLLENLRTDLPAESRISRVISSPSFTSLLSE